MNLRHVPWTLTLALTPSLAHAQGQILFEQLPNQFNFTYADTDCDVCGALSGFDQSVAENFVITTSSSVQLNQIVLWGVHDNGTALDPNAFDINIYTDSGGTAGTLVYSAFDVPATAVATGQTIGFGMEEEAEVTLTPLSPPSLLDGTYWIEIYNNTTTTTASWAWESAPFDPIHGIDGYIFSTTAPGGVWFPDNYQPGSPSGNMAMRLIGEGGAGLGTNYCITLPNSTGSAAAITALGSDQPGGQTC